MIWVNGALVLFYAYLVVEPGRRWKPMWFLFGFVNVIAVWGQI